MFPPRGWLGIYGGMSVITYRHCSKANVMPGTCCATSAKKAASFGIYSRERLQLVKLVKSLSLHVACFGHAVTPILSMSQSTCTVTP